MPQVCEKTALRSQKESLNESCISRFIGLSSLGFPSRNKFLDK